MSYNLFIIITNGTYQLVEIEFVAVKDLAPQEVLLPTEPLNHSTVLYTP